MLHVQFKQLADCIVVVGGHGVGGLVDAIEKWEPGTDFKSVPYLKNLSSIAYADR